MIPRLLAPLAAILSAALVASGCGTTQDAPPAPVDPGPRPLGLNDVSVLIPLPPGLDAPGFLRPADQDAMGELLPKAVYDVIPRFPVEPAEGLIYERLRVLALRVDGCSGLPGSCHPEIRLVMQPVNPDGSVRDSALHLFYRLDETTMARLVEGLRQLRALEPETPVDAPLDVHPSLVAQGVEGAYGQGLRTLVLHHAGATNLVRITFFLRAPPVTDVWTFGGLERAEDGTYKTMKIVGLDDGLQRVILNTTHDFSYDLTPNPITPEDGRPLLSAAAMEAAPSSRLKAAMGSYLRLENPTKYVPDQLSCAGCHLSTFVTAEAGRRYGLAPADFADDAFTSSRDLSLKGGAETKAKSLRAFGWFGKEAMIARRTVNDTAAVLDALEAKFP